MAFIHRNVVNSYISYKLDTWSRDLNADFTLGNCLFGAVKLTAMLVLINMDIVVMVLDLMHVHNFNCQMATGVKTLSLLVLI